MRHWDRARWPVTCGRCSRVIPAGDPVLGLRIGTMTRALHRCVDCEGPAPELPPLPVQKQVSELVGMSTLGSINPKTRGALKATAREWTPYRDSRDPGEDG